MFNSGIKAADLIKQIKDEADIAIPIPDINYITWLNALEQLLYTELIQEQECIYTQNTDGGSVLSIPKLPEPNDYNTISFEDIHAVYADETQLIKSTPASFEIFPNTYCKFKDKIRVNLSKEPRHLKIIYFVKPKLKTTDNIGTTNVMLPVEFIDLAKAKLRGEAYKLSNEDGLAAKWINDYNALLEVFKTWLAAKAPKFGL